MNLITCVYDFLIYVNTLIFKSLISFQTAFVIFYMLTAPLFGYLGDRYSRKWILVVGLSMWSLSTLFGSFARNFWVFMFWRALVGIGEASYSTIGMLITKQIRLYVPPI